MKAFCILSLILFFNYQQFLMYYNRHGQSAGCGPHAALQTFLWPLSFKYTIPRQRLFGKILLFKPKYDIFDEHFRNLQRNFRNNYVPLYPLDICHMFGMNLRPQEHSKLLKMAPD